MWVVLLDHSGSMAERFAGSSTFSGKSVKSGGGTKLDEARRSVYERVRGLSPKEQVVVIEFTTTASVVFEGFAAQTAEIEAALSKLVAADGTSIAAAFDAAAEYHRLKGKINSRVLLVSDCKSELEPAIASADALTQLVYIIDILLIDPDPETEVAARALIRLGEVQAVVSAEELRTAITAGDRVSEQVTAAMARALEEAAEAAAEGLNLRAQTEGEPIGSEVGFGAAYAPWLAPGRPAPLWVSIHPADVEDAERQILRQLMSGNTSDARISDGGRTRLANGALIRIEPAISGIHISPGRIDFIWNDRVERFQFTMNADTNASTGANIIGSVNLWYGPAHIACLPFAVKIGTGQTGAAPIAQRSGLFQSVFPSYSRRDKAVVERARGYYEALGIAVYQDTGSLRSLAGANWARAIDGLILKADAFQLYWSASSAASEQVEREWQFALGQNALKGERWIRPVRWMEDVPDLPSPIAHLQMGWLPGYENTQRAIPPEAVAVRCVVMPLVDCPPEQLRIVERECREAVHQVETVTGLRCYPPPILLVDEFTIAQESPRRETRNLDELIFRFAAAADVLKALSLDVHTHFGRGKLNGEPSPYVDELTLSLSNDSRRLALRLAEWVFAFAADTILDLHGFIQPRKYGVFEGLPQKVAPSKGVGESIGNPSWRTELESFGASIGLAPPDLVDCFKHLLRCLSTAFDETERIYGNHAVYITGYGTAAQSLQVFHPSDVRVELSGSESWSHLSGTIPALKHLFTGASEVFLETFQLLLGSKGSRGGYAESHTYGVFLPAGIEADRHFATWASKHNISEFLTCPGSDRVLLCLDSIRQVTLQMSNSDERWMVRRSILIHELFHAAILSAIGQDESRRAALRKATQVEEALAVWLEFDAARGSLQMRNLIQKYAASGKYPEWPYAGMSTVESIFSVGGREAIQTLIQQLTANPASLQTEFDVLVKQEEQLPESQVASNIRKTLKRFRTAFG